tara:strand:+ start:221 stop:799 length:579 start_codon:yes stop_codon:yes gene_type:complete
MATGNGNQQQNNNQPIQGRKIAGTNVAYTGMVVKLGEFEYTTVGGGIEGDRQQLEPMNTNTPQDIVNPMSTSETSNNPNPVVRTFRNRFQGPAGVDRIYEYIRTDGSPGSMNLHEHQDGTIMEGHDPNNMGVVVMLNPIFGTINPNPNIPSIGGNGGNGATTGGTRGGSSNNNPGGNVGGGNTGGGMGGGSY